MRKSLVIRISDGFLHTRVSVTSRLQAPGPLAGVGLPILAVSYDVY
jgi:hypothetical protein